MRQGQQNRRGRGRGRKVQNPLARNFESNGPDVKIRGTAAHIAEKYGALARDAAASGDSVTAENYLQHAEHYNRIIMAAQAQMQPNSPQPDGGANGAGGQRHRRHGEEGGRMSGDMIAVGDDMDETPENAMHDDAPRGPQRHEGNNRRRANGSADDTDSEQQSSEDAPDSIVA